MNNQLAVAGFIAAAALLLKPQSSSDKVDKTKRLGGGGGGGSEPNRGGEQFACALFWSHKTEAGFQLLGYSAGDVFAGAALRSRFSDTQTRPAVYWQWGAPGYFRSAESGRRDWYTMRFLPDNVVGHDVAGGFFIPAGLIDSGIFDTGPGQIFAATPEKPVGTDGCRDEALRLGTEYTGRGRNLLKTRRNVRLYRVDTSGWADHWSDVILARFPEEIAGIIAAKPILVEF
jgi:hypothetical protein